MTAQLGVSTTGTPFVPILPRHLGTRPLLFSLQQRVIHKQPQKRGVVPRQVTSRQRRHHASSSAQSPLTADSMAKGCVLWRTAYCRGESEKLPRNQTLIRRHVFLFVPNLVGYLRLCLLAGSLVTGTAFPAATLILLCFNLLLDGLDGYLARRLGQVQMMLMVQMNCRACHQRLSPAN